VTEEQLDLLKLAARRSAEFCAGASQVVGRDSGDANRGGILLEHLPDDLFAEALAGYGAREVHWAEEVPGVDARRRRPGVDCHFHPRWHRRRSNAGVLADEINDAPAAISLLDVRER
jgi:putative hemolysin